MADDMVNEQIYTIPLRTVGKSLHGKSKQSSY